MYLNTLCYTHIPLKIIWKSHKDYKNYKSFIQSYLKQNDHLKIT